MSGDDVTSLKVTGAGQKKLLGDVLCDRFVVSQGALVQDMLVNALAYAANADVAKAVHGPHLKWSYPYCYFRPKKFAHLHPNLKYPPELREYEFISSSHLLRAS